MDNQKCSAIVNNRNVVFIIFALFSLLGVFFFPRYELGSYAKIRLEDVTFIFLFFIIALRILTGRFHLYKDSLLIILYLLFPFFVSLTMVLDDFGKGIYFLVFWGKELQYYIFFIAFSYLFTKKNAITAIVYALICLVTINATIGAYKVLMGLQDYYGIGAMFFEDSPSLSGQIYFGCMIICALILYLKLIENKLVRFYLCLLMVVSFICCLATMSKSSSFGIIGFVCVFLILHDFYSIKSINTLLLKIFKWTFGVIFGILFLYCLIYKWNYQISNINLARLRNPVESMIVRYEQDLKPKFTKFDNSFYYITGVGYLAGQRPDTPISFGSAFDNQYVRNILVMGIVGSAIWFIMLFFIGWTLKGNPKLFIFYTSLLSSYLLMGMGLESFQLSKSGPIFWIVTGMLLGMKREFENNQSEPVVNQTLEYLTEH